MDITNINVDGYIFEGPYPINETHFNEIPGIYLISDWDGKFIDVGETESLKNRLASHDRKDCWSRNANQVINVWFHHEQNAYNRLEKEKYIRNLHPFKCGLI